MEKRDVLRAARRSSAKAVVEESLRPAMEAVDAKASALPMPQLAAQHAVARIDALLASPQAARMQHLAEIAMFHQRGLIDDDQLDQALFFAAGDDGLRLLHADLAERVELAATMVAKEVDKE
jgi:hypothetical protein